MAYKTFTSGAILPAADIKTYLMDQAVVTCTSTTHPSSPPKGMVIYETDTDTYLYCSNASGPVWTLAVGKFQYKTSTQTVSLTNTVFVKDGGTGDIQFSVISSSVLYRFRYIVRITTDTNGVVVDTRINDGGSTTPTNASPTIAAAGIYIATVGNGASQLVCEGIGSFSIGSHTIAGFYARTGGSVGNIGVTQSTGESRILSVEALT